MSTEIVQGRDPSALAAELVEQGVRYVFSAYVDVHGVPKSKCVPVEHLVSMAHGSELYTVGALEGMGELGPNEDEVHGVPDLDSVVVLPWDRQHALAFADLVYHGAPYSHDSRHVLRRQIAAAAQLGYAVNVGVEPEFYVLRERDGDFVPWLAEDGYNDPTRGYDVETTMLARSFTHPMVEYMQALGWDPYSFVHEGGDGQYEFEFRYADALSMADRMVLFRLMAKHVARSLGCVASFMPKPFSDNFGSAAHINMSLADGDTGENLFGGEGSPETAAMNGDPGAHGYSKLGYRFTAGVLRHSGAITAIACPTVNSYKRLLPMGFMRDVSWAPVYRAFGHNNRTLMCRLPMNRYCLELRTADAGCNFYLAMAVMLAAGLEGIREALDPGAPVADDTYSLDDETLAARGIRRLPTTLAEALDELEADELAREVLGAEFHRTFVDYKREEWRAYNSLVSKWERDQYLLLW